MNSEMFPYVFTVITGLIAYWVKTQDSRLRDVEAEVHNLRTAIAVITTEYTGLKAQMHELLTNVKEVRVGLDRALYGMAHCQRDDKPSSS